MESKRLPHRIDHGRPEGRRRVMVQICHELDGEKEGKARPGAIGSRALIYVPS